jgi:hypothetical protein
MERVVDSNGSDFEVGKRAPSVAHEKGIPWAGKIVLLGLAIPAIDIQEPHVALKAYVVRPVEGYKGAYAG